MTDQVDADVVAVHQPETDAATLAEIAGRRPDLGPAIAAHPNAYDGLLDWLASYGTDDVRAAVAARRQPPAAAPIAAPSNPGPPRQRTRLSRRAWIVILTVVGVAVAATIVPLVISGINEQRAAQAVELDINVSAGSSSEGIHVTVADSHGRILKRLTTDANGNAVFRHPVGGTFVVAVDPVTLPKPFTIPAKDLRQTLTLSDGDDQSASFVANGPPTPTPTPTPAAGQWTFATSSGYSYTMQLSLSAPTTSGENGETTDEHGSNQPGQWTTAPNKIGSLCTDFDPKTDVAIPAQLTLTATTNGFDTPLTANISIQTVSSTATSDTPPASLQTISLESEDFYSSNSTCQSWPGSSAGINWDTPTARGDSGTWYFTVIIKNYRSPNAPNGDASLLDWVTVQPVSSVSSATGVGTYTQQSGPSAVTLAGNPVNQ